MRTEWAWTLDYFGGFLEDHRIIEWKCNGLIVGVIVIAVLQIVCLWKLHKLDKRLKEKDESPHPSE